MKKHARSRGQLLLFLLFSLCFLALSCVFLYTSLFISRPSVKAAAPPSNHSPVTVIIDAGHGGEDGGAVGINGALEKDINLEVAKKTQLFLSSFGIKSVPTRDSDVLLYDRNEDYEGRKKVLDMQARRKIAESYENAVFVSIHQNAFPQEKYSGFQVYYSPNNEESRSLAELLEEGVRASLQPQNGRDSKPSGGSIYLLDKLNCPAVLVECGFMSNAEECEKLSTEEYQNQLAAVIASAIAEFVGGYEGSDG